MNSSKILVQNLLETARWRHLHWRHIRFYSGCLRPVWPAADATWRRSPLCCQLINRPHHLPARFHTASSLQGNPADKTTDPAAANVGLANQIMAAKIAAATSKEQAAGHKEEEPNAEKSGPQPMPKWQKYSYIALGVLMGGSLVGNAVLFSLPDKDEQGNSIEDDYSSLPFPSQYYNRLKNKIFSTKKAIEEPFSDKLLPDPLEPPYYQPKYTVVLGNCIHHTSLY